MRREFFILAIAASLSAQQAVTVSSAGASASANVTPGAPPVVVTVPTPSAIITASITSVPTTITLPIEVIGPTGYTASVNFTLATVPTGPLALYLQIHGLSYVSEGSVQLNNSVWLALSTPTVTLLGLDAAYGGIGGGFHTHQMTINLPAGVVVAGTNVINFRFNGTDGLKDGFRVLALNVQSNGTNLIPASTFAQTNPATWTPPLNDSVDIAAGLVLWQTAALTDPASGANVAITAHCADCHAVDGRDLKYFNYSNQTIEARAAFHGLTAQQGLQIASYIRSLTSPSPGLPWNPPYQPGPGIDSSAVAVWSAGAGLSAVLGSDSAILASLPIAQWQPTASLSVRNTPIALQLPDWNSWLPQVHPKDSWPTTFPTSQLWANYQAIRANLVANNAASYKANQFPIWNWTQLDHYTFLASVIVPAGNAQWKNPAYVQSLGGLEAWSMVKLWEIHQSYGLEGMCQTAFGAKADARCWDSSQPFAVAPQFYTPTGTAVGNGLTVTYDYQSFQWYHLQLILNWRNNVGNGQGPTEDFPYVYNNIFHFNLDSGLPQGVLETLWLIKGMQASQNGLGPQVGSGGWSIGTNNGFFRLAWNVPALWAGETQNASTVLNDYLPIWLQQVGEYTIQDFYTGTWFTATDAINPLLPANGYGSSMAYSIPRLKFFGLNATTLAQLTAWAQSAWPNYNWAGLASTVCTTGTPDLACAPYPQ